MYFIFPLTPLLPIILSCLHPPRLYQYFFQRWQEGAEVVLPSYQGSLQYSCAPSSITRDHVHKGILERFERLLNDYFRSDKPQITGLPSVAYCAQELNLSANYFGDLIKKETGKSAQEYLQTKLIDIAKEKIFDPSKSVSQIAYELGFKYPQHFTRFFKQRVGQTPNEYRMLN